jgi:hypothetical protein
MRASRPPGGCRRVVHTPIDIGDGRREHRRGMRSDRCLRISTLVAGLAAAIVGNAAETMAQARGPHPSDPNASSPLEQALIEHACRRQPPGEAEDDAYQECLGARLRALRADFGRDLNRISPAKRKALDAACGDILRRVGPDAYLECLTVQLISMRNRGSGASPTAPQESALPSPPESLRSAALPMPAGENSWRISPMWIGATLVALFVAGGAAFMGVIRRPKARKCRACGVEISKEGGDLCAKCRHEAAETLRREAAERTDHERARIAEQQRQSEREEELRRRLAREEEEVRLRYQEEERQRQENARQREREEEESRRRGREAVESEAVFDPYAILGVPRETARASIDAAWQEARLKYAPEQVAHLGPELQEHYRQKAEAVERAYRMLTD